MATKKKKNVKLVPKLRFPEFVKDGAWHQAKLSSLASPVKEKAKSVKPDDVLTLSGKYGLIRQTEYFGKKIAGENLSRYLKIRQNDFVYNDRTTSSNKYGSLKRLTNHSTGAVSPIYKCFRFDTEAKSIYWENYFEAGAHENELSQFINEGARAGRFNISVDMFLSIYVTYPNNAEQQKIADCLSSLDKIISAHSTKLGALQDHKKGLLQKLFPAKGKNSPKLRFPEFATTKNWKKITLKELFTIFQGFAFSSQDSTNNGVRWLKIANVGILSMNPNKPSFLPEGHKTEYDRFRVTQGDYVIALTRPFLNHQLKIAKVDSTYDGALLNQRVGKLISSINADFVYYLLQTSLLTSMIEKQIAGNDPPNLSSNQISELLINIPQPREQQEIANCLSSLDSQITAQSQKNTSLKDLKKGLMQQLFPYS